MTDRSVRIPTGLAAILDAVCLVVFAAVGRQTHAEAWTGAFTTAAPFLVGGAIGWALWWAVRREAPVGLSGGAVVWLAAVVAGMLLRQLTGQGTAWTFVIVTLIVTGVLLLGWRAIAALILRRRGRAAAPAPARP